MPGMEPPHHREIRRLKTEITGSGYMGFENPYFQQVVKAEKIYRGSYQYKYPLFSAETDMSY